MQITTRIRMEWKSLWFCATLGAAAAMVPAQTPGNGMYIHQYTHADNYTEYIDLDAGRTVSWNPDGTYPRFYHANSVNSVYLSSTGICYEFGFFQQGITPIPDWTIWVEGPSGWVKVSDNFNGTLLPSLRIWVPGNGDLNSVQVIFASKVDNTSGQSSGAAWSTQTQRYISQASCESGSMGIVRMSAVAKTKPVIVRIGS